MITIEVKSKQKAEFPFCKGIKGDNTFLVFVDFRNKEPTTQPDFYVLNEKNWIDLINDRIQENKRISMGQDNCPIVTQLNKGKHSGTVIRLKKLQAYFQNWDIIKDALR